MKKRTKAKGRERRRTQRLNISIPIKYKILPRKRVLEETLCHDISGGGIRVTLNYPLKKGIKLKTLLHFPSDPKPIVALSKVVWCRKMIRQDGPELYDVGIEHINISPKDKAKFILLFCEMMINFFILGSGK